jgi:hypothetical protein
MIRLDIEIQDQAGPALARIRTGLTNLKPLNTRIAADAERFLKRSGKGIAAGQHNTASTLGARPTRHLEKAYQAIEGEGGAEQATIRVPRASRLRAAFGDYVVRPGSGKKYLTIPANKAAYGRRAGEFENLVFVRVGPRQTPALARKVRGREDRLEVMYFLTRAAKIKHEPTLINFQLLAEEARDSAQAFLDDLSKGGRQ